MKKFYIIINVVLMILLTACFSNTESAVSSLPNQQISNSEVKVDNTKKEEEFKQALKEYLDGNFGYKTGNTSWYPYIKGYVIQIDQETVVTVNCDGSTTDSDILTKANKVVGAFLGFLNDNTNVKYRADKVVVVDMSGNIIIEEKTILKP